MTCSSRRVASPTLVETRIFKLHLSKNQLFLDLVWPSHVPDSVGVGERQVLAVLGKRRLRMVEIKIIHKIIIYRSVKIIFKSFIIK